MTETTTGRQLDAAVAQHIMGWGHVLDSLGVLTGQPLPMEQVEHWTSGVPHYSTDIQDAWTVIEHLRAQGWEVTIGTEQGNWACFMWHEEIEIGYEGYAIAGAVSPPEAVCRAALKTVETENEVDSV